MNLFQLSYIFLMVLLLQACGGGGSSDPEPAPTPAPTNQSPTVSAGHDIQVEEGMPVTLQATASDPDGQIASYTWSQVSGQAVSLTTTNNATLTFTAPSLTEPSTLTFSVTVADNDGAETVDEVNVLVNPTPVEVSDYRFIVTPIEGLNYNVYQPSEDDQGPVLLASNQTTEMGEYECVEDSYITFSVGPIELGQVECQPFISLFVFSPSGGLDGNNVVQNINVLLQSLDEDFDYTNGIQLPDSVNDSSDVSVIYPSFSTPLENFVVDPLIIDFVQNNSDLMELISPQEATENYQDTIDQIQDFFVENAPADCIPIAFPCAPDTNTVIDVVLRTISTYQDPRSPVFGATGGSTGNSNYQQLFNRTLFSDTNSLHNLAEHYPDIYDITEFADEVDTGIVVFYRSEPIQAAETFLYLNDRFTAQLPHGAAQPSELSAEQCGLLNLNTLTAVMPQGTYKFGSYGYGGNRCRAPLSEDGPLNCSVYYYDLASIVEGTFTVNNGECLYVDVSGEDVSVITKSVQGSWEDMDEPLFSLADYPTYALTVYSDFFVRFQVTAPGFTSLLWVLDENDNIVYETPSDPVGDEDVEIPLRAGDYKLVVVNAAFNEPGDFTLTVIGDTSTPVLIPGETDPDQNELSTVTGQVVAEGVGVANAQVRVEYVEDNVEKEIVEFTDQTGAFELSIPLELLPDTFLILTTKDGYLPGSQIVSNQTVEGIIIELEPAGNNKVALEIVPSLHHLGDDSFTGASNSQFQRTTEGTEFSVSFELTPEQLNFTSVVLRIKIKGVDLPVIFKFNDAEYELPGNITPADGSFGNLSITLDENTPFSTQNTLTIMSTQNSWGDYDDFEFANIILEFELVPEPGMVDLSLFEDNGLRTCVADLNELEITRINSLFCSNAGVSDLAGLEQLTELTTLRLWNNEITDLSPIENLIKLTSLDAGYNNISDIGPLRNLLNLETLELGDNGIISTSALLNLSNLGELDLEYNSLSSVDEISALTSLYRLSLSGNSIGDISLLSRLQNLSDLWLLEIDISCDTLDSLEAALPNTDIRHDQCI